MNRDWLSLGIVLAQENRLDELFSRMGEGLRGERGGLSSNQVICGLVAVAALVLLGWSLLRVFSPQACPNSPRRLFLSLCRAHGLPWAETWLLWRVARARQLHEPARLFLEPEWLAPEELPPAFQPRAEQLRSLAKRLFAGLNTPG